MNNIFKSFLMYKFKIIFVSMLLLAVFQACTSDFEDINKSLNPLANINDTSTDSLFVPGIDLGRAITDVELKQLQSNVENMGTIFRKFSYEGVYNNYQRTTNLTHDIYAGYFANLNPSFLALTPTYNHSESWSNHRWNHFYQDRTVEYGELVRTFWFVKHDFEKNTGVYLNAFYITRIYYAFLISMQTDSYGDIPLTDKHLQGISDSESPKYRKQEEVYDIIFKLLDEALSNINPVPAEDSFNLGEDDRCYGGDVKKWIRFANTLRLRLALRISAVDPERARKEGEAALSHPGGLMTGQEDNMRTIPKYATVDMGGENSGGDENIYALCSYTWSDAGLNKDLETAYKSLSSVLDPRCPVCWYRPLEENSTLDDPIESTKDFLGVQTGDPDIQKPSFMHSRLRSYARDGKKLRDDAWFGLARESVWLSYAESRFLLAEAALREWGGVELSHIDYFLQGITASMSYYKIPEASINEYIAGLKIFTEAGKNPFESTDKEAMLKQIIIHKWLAIFPNGNEAWAEFRRTDYPDFISLPLFNNSGGRVAEGKFIQRINYPGSESLNNVNFPYPQGLRADARMWWDLTETTNENGERNLPNNFSIHPGQLFFNMLKNR